MTIIDDDLDVAGEEQELFEHYAFKIDKGQSPLRIDVFLSNRIENVSRSKIQNAAKANCVLVNKKPIKPNYKVKPFDEISIVLPHPPRELELIAQDIPIRIVYEDDDIIVVNKNPGMVVHPGYNNYTGTLVNALVFHFNKSNLDADELLMPRLVHRIDKNTSGILVVAKSEIAQVMLAKYFFQHTIQRKYMALVWGDVPNENGTITGNIGRGLKDRKVMEIFPEGDYGKHAVTHYKVIERFRYVTLVECELETGRTHQIRAHFKYIGHPLFNDDTYGGNRLVKGVNFSKYKQFVENCFEILPRQALHAKTLGFKHPITMKDMLFDSEIPDDMAAVIERWRNYTLNSSDK